MEKEEIIKDVISILCNDIKNALLTGIEEHPDEFTCIDFVAKQKEKQKDADLNKLIDQNHDNLYKEAINYLSS